MEKIIYYVGLVFVIGIFGLGLVELTNRLVVAQDLRPVIQQEVSWIVVPENKKTK